MFDRLASARGYAVNPDRGRASGFRLWPVLALVAIAGCSLNPSVLHVNGKALDRIAAIAKDAAAQAVREAPTPYLDVQGPPPEKIIDWPELVALLGMGLGGIAHRYYYHRKHGGKT